MQVKAGLLFDFGNSGTRIVLLAGNKAYRFDLSNRFVELPEGYQINNKYANGKSTVFKVGGSYYANGQIVDVEFAGKEMRPTSLQSKTAQITTELSINLAVIRSLQILSQAYNLPVDALEVSFTISALLPPLDHEVNEGKMIELIKSVTYVNSLMPLAIAKGVAIDEDTNIYSEAVAAFFGAIYTEEGAIPNPQNEGKSVDNGDILVLDNGKSVVLSEVSDNEKFKEGYVLVLDIGAGTTDVALFLDMELIESSKDTFKRGGNTVKSIVSNEIRKKFSYAPTDKMLDEVIRTGKLAEGSTYHDVADILTSAKVEYSKATKEDIRQYLERMSVALPVVKGLLAAGGGALETRNPQGEIVSPAMTEVLVEFLRELARNLEAVNTSGKNLRELNIDGLTVIHKNA